MLNKQEILNAVYKRFIVDRKPWGMGAEKCVYTLARDPEIRCVIGMFIPDKHINAFRNVERGAAELMDEEMKMFPFERSVWTTIYGSMERSLPTRLQKAHDFCATLEAPDDVKRKVFQENLNDIAEMVGCVYPQISTYFGESIE